LRKRTREKWKAEHLSGKEKARANKRSIIYRRIFTRRIHIFYIKRGEERGEERERGCKEEITQLRQPEETED